MKNVRALLAAAVLPLAVLASCCLAPTTATLIIRNDSTHILDKVYIAPIDSPDMGEDLLDVIIPHGGTHTFRRIEAGAYDVLIGDTEGGWWPAASLVLEPGDEITLPLTD